MRKIGITKHELIIRYIKDLKVGTKVSVRQIAKELEVSDGTAYRAIKAAESQGFVSSIPKVGTIRIEEEEEKELEDLSFREISLIVEGEVLCGKEKLGKLPSQFVIAATSKDILEKYIEKDALLLVGDLEELQECGIEKGANLLVTGGFSLSEDLLKKAEEKGLLVIKSPYDTFVITSMINKAIYERLTSKELVRVEDIMNTEVHYLSPDATIRDWYDISKKTLHSRFPVVDKNKVVVGIVSAVDVAGKDLDTSILAVMSTDVLTANKKTLVTHLSRILIWEGFELVPIINDAKRLEGVVSRQDILKAFQQAQKQPQVGETIDNLALSGFSLEEWDEGLKIKGDITEFMVDELGSASIGTLVIALSTAAYIHAKKSLKKDAITENFTLYQLTPPEVGSSVEIYSRILKIEKKSCTFQIDMFSNNEMKAKAITSLRVVRK